MQKLQSAPAIQFKGSGWYITDYARKESAPAGKTDGKTDPPAKTPEKTDAPAATAPKSDTPAPAKSDGGGTKSGD